MKKIIIAVDGHSSCGKSTTAKAVAKAIGYSYIDTGAMYRAVTLYFLNNNIDFSNNEQIEDALNHISIDFRFNPETENNETFLNNENVEDEIRSMRVAEKVSDVAALSLVRKKLSNEQKRMGESKGIVMDGRDIGTNVFPDAELKIFMTAHVKTRAERRQQELAAKNQFVALTDVIDNLQERDRIDSSRKDSPLKKADDAIMLDTTYHTIESQIQFIIDYYYETINEFV